MTISLLNVLRQELNAVNQQFIHILALQAWGEMDAAERITRVDNIDFPNAMRIIDHLASGAATIELEPSGFSPGQDYDSMLVAEREMEQRLSQALDDADAADEAEALLLGGAREPRQAYSEWLLERTAENTAAEAQPPPEAAETATTVAYLITLMEQSMVHAFLHWHRDERTAADAAWATSGAMMMHLTRLVRAFAKLPGVPFPGNCPPLELRGGARQALQSEQRLALLCEREALAAADRCADKTVAGLCRQIAGFCAEFVNWESSNPHPAGATNPPCFGSFEATLKKFVRGPGG
jgi:hypothetical protein